MTWRLRTPNILVSPDGDEAVFSRNETAKEVCESMNACATISKDAASTASMLYELHGSSTDPFWKDVTKICRALLLCYSRLEKTL